MATVNKKRVLRPSTRMESSTRYRVDVRRVGRGDILRLAVAHEVDQSLDLIALEYSGDELEGIDSLYFDAREEPGGWRLAFTPVRPLGVIVRSPDVPSSP